MDEFHNSFVCLSCQAYLPLEKFCKRKSGNKVILICPICRSNKIVPVLIAIRNYCESIYTYIRNTRNIWNLISWLLNSCEYVTNTILELEDHDIYVPARIIEELIDIEAKADYLVSVLLKITKRSEFLIDHLIKFSRNISDLIEKLNETKTELRNVCNFLLQTKNLVKKLNKIRQYIEKKREILDLGIKLPNRQIERIINVVKLSKANLVFTNLSLIVISRKKVIRAPLKDVKVKIGRLSTIVIHVGKKKIKEKVKNPKQLLREIIKIIDHAREIKIVNIKELLEERQLIKLHNWKDLGKNVRKLSEKYQQMMKHIKEFLRSKPKTEGRKIKYSLPYGICS